MRYRRLKIVEKIPIIVVCSLIEFDICRRIDAWISLFFDSSSKVKKFHLLWNKSFLEEHARCCVCSARVMLCCVVREVAYIVLCAVCCALCGVCVLCVM